jgi:hypothetical protein
MTPLPDLGNSGYDGNDFTLTAGTIYNRERTGGLCALRGRPNPCVVEGKKVID